MVKKAAGVVTVVYFSSDCQLVGGGGGGGGGGVSSLRGCAKFDAHAKAARAAAAWARADYSK